MSWQLRPGDDAVIKEQIEEAEGIVAREVAEFEARYPPEKFVREDPDSISVSKDEQPGEQQKSTDEPQQQQAESNFEQQTNSVPEADTKGPQDSSVNPTESPNHEPSSDADKVLVTPANGDEANHEHHESHRDDDGGEVVEDNEDTVIY